MAQNNWQQVKKILIDAMRHAPEERPHFLDRVCNGDKTLRWEVESLLSSYDSATSFLETPVSGGFSEFIQNKNRQLEDGEIFAHYEIIRQIGAGGMGEVYLAKDKKLACRVVIKILNEKFAEHESNLQRFTQETQAASALNHPNILTIHEIGGLEDVHYIVCEYVEGKTLRQILTEKTLQLPEILDIAIQIANALTAAHAVGIVHRDIKPENIMIRPDGFVEVLDFGLAKIFEQKNKSILSLEDETSQQNQTAKGVILGIVNYMSPKQTFLILLTGKILVCNSTIKSAEIWEGDKHGDARQENSVFFEI